MDQWDFKGFSSSEGVSVPSLYITYNRKPPWTTNVAPANDSVLTTTTPTMVATPVSDPDGDNPVWYYYRLATGADAESGEIINSGWVQQTQWTVPAGY